MSVLDYCKKLVLFSSIEYRVVDLLIKEFLMEDPLFAYLKKIDINKEIEIYWYKDSSDKVAGGLHFLGALSKNKKMAIYINAGVIGLNLDDYYENENVLTRTVFSRISMVFETIVHELKHYEQYRKCPFLYFWLQFPFLRNYTIEKAAYKVSDKIYEMQVGQSLNMVDEFCLKYKYNFPVNYFIKREVELRDLLKVKDLDPMKLFYGKGMIISQCIEQIQNK